MQVSDDRFQAESGWWNILTLHGSGRKLLTPSGVFYCTFGTGKFHAGFWWPLPSRVRMEPPDSADGVKSFLPLPSRVRMFHPDSAWKRSSEICMNLTSDECTVENSWWWTEKIPETYKVLWQNKFGIIIASGWLFKKKSIRNIFARFVWGIRSEERNVPVTRSRVLRLFL